MRTLLVSSARWIGAITLGAYPLVMHATYVWSRSSATGGILLWAELALLAAILILRFRRWRGAIILIVILSALPLAVRRTTSDALVVASGVPYAAAYIGLLFFFGSSLLPGRTPIISLLSEKLNIDPLTPAMLNYTRNVTILWTVFFAAQLVISAFLFFNAPTTVWSFFVNVLNLPLNLSVFAGEYIWRRFHVPAFRHRSFADIVRTLQSGFDLHTIQGSPPP